MYHPSISGLSLTSTFSSPRRRFRSAMALLKVGLSTSGGRTGISCLREMLGGTVLLEYNRSFNSFASLRRRTGVPLCLSCRVGIGDVAVTIVANIVLDEERTDEFQCKFSVVRGICDSSIFKETVKISNYQLPLA